MSAKWIEQKLILEDLDWEKGISQKDLKILDNILKNLKNSEEKSQFYIKIIEWFKSEDITKEDKKNIEKIFEQYLEEHKDSDTLTISAYKILKTLIPEEELKEPTKEEVEIEKDTEKSRKDLKEERNISDEIKKLEKKEKYNKKISETAKEFWISIEEFKNFLNIFDDKNNILLLLNNYLNIINNYEEEKDSKWLKKQTLNNLTLLIKNHWLTKWDKKNYFNFSHSAWSILSEIVNRNKGKSIEKYKERIITEAKKENEKRNKDIKKIEKFFPWIKINKESFDNLKWGETNNLRPEKMLLDIKDKIDSFLNLPNKDINKLKNIVTKKFNIISSYVKEINNEYSNNEISKTEFSSERFKIQAKFEEQFKFVNTELLPNIAFLNKFESRRKLFGRQINSKYDEVREIWNNITIDDDWNLSGWMFDFFDPNLYVDYHYAKKEDAIDEVDILSEKDKEVKENAEYTFYALIAWQIAVETMGWLAGTVIWWGVDFYDVFSENEALIILWQKMWLIPKDFATEKLFIDNVLAWIWLLPWVTQAIKWTKLANFLSRKSLLELDKFFIQVDKVWQKMWLEEWHLNTWIRNFMGIDWKPSVNSVNKNSKLWDIERTDKAEKLLWWEKLSDKKKDAILEAHEVWKDIEWASDLLDWKELTDKGYDIKTLTNTELFKEIEKSISESIKSKNLNDKYTDILLRMIPHLVHYLKGNETELLIFLKNNKSISVDDISLYLYKSNNFQYLEETIYLLGNWLDLKFLSGLKLNYGINNYLIKELVEFDKKNIKSFLSLYSKGSIHNNTNIKIIEQYKLYVEILKENTISNMFNKNITYLLNNDVDTSIYWILKISDLIPNIDFTQISLTLLKRTHNSDILEFVKKDENINLFKENNKLFYEKLNNLEIDNFSKEIWVDVSKYIKISDFKEPKNISFSKIREYKKELIKNKKIFWSIVKNVENIMEKNPNIEIEEILKLTSNKWVNFSWNIKIEIISKIKEYHTKVQKIDNLLVKYKWKTNDLLKYVYWTETKWKITVERKSSGIVFYVSDKKDYDKVYNWENPQSTWWFNTSYSEIKELEWSITFVNWDNKWAWSYSEKTKAHESRHALNDIIFDWNKNPLEMWKDEIIAFLSDGSSIARIKKTLTKEDWLYNYFKHLKWNDSYEKEWWHYKISISKRIDEAWIIKEMFPDNYLNILSVFDAKEWKLLAKEIPKDLKLKMKINKFFDDNFYMFKELKMVLIEVVKDPLLLLSIILAAYMSVLLIDKIGSDWKMLNRHIEKIKKIIWNDKWEEIYNKIRSII